MFYDCTLVGETLFELDSFSERPWRAAMTDSTVEREIEREARESSRRRQIRFNDHPFRRRHAGIDWTAKVPRSTIWNSRAREFEHSFRTLRRLSASTGNIDDELNFHALELDARNARTDVSIFERALIFSYRAFSDFGRSMWRPIWTFLVFASLLVSIATPFTWNAVDKYKLGLASLRSPTEPEVAMYVARNFIPPPPVWAENLGRSWAIGLDDTAQSLLLVLGTLQTLAFVGFVALFLIAMRRRFQIRD